VLLRVVLVLLVVAAILWWLRSRARSRAFKGAPRAQQPQAFTRCAHCGVHLPMSDAVTDGRIAYCSEAHRLAGPRERDGS
jgi:uncharacterized protein